MGQRPIQWPKSLISNSLHGKCKLLDSSSSSIATYAYVLIQSYIKDIPPKHTLFLSPSLYFLAVSLFFFSRRVKKKERDRKKMTDHEMRSSTSSLIRHLVILYYIEKKLLPDFLRFWRCDSTKLSGNSKRAPRAAGKVDVDRWKWRFGCAILDVWSDDECMFDPTAGRAWVLSFRIENLNRI